MLGVIGGPMGVTDGPIGVIGGPLGGGPMADITALIGVIVGPAKGVVGRGDAVGINGPDPGGTRVDAPKLPATGGAGVLVAVGGNIGLSSGIGAPMGVGGGRKIAVGALSTKTGGFAEAAINSASLRAN